MDDIERVRRACEDDDARRELLWLRAQEKNDAESIELLERADSRLRARMTALLAGTGIDRIEDPRERSEAFARLWHERFDAL